MMPQTPVPPPPGPGVSAAKLIERSPLMPKSDNGAARPPFPVFLMDCAKALNIDSMPSNALSQAQKFMVGSFRRRCRQLALYVCGVERGGRVGTDGRCRLRR